ncbi:recombinase family protein [Nocardioides sp. NBC_00368]|uniref:recombinase family protein n=1 Tax=Nocardioides sp. NBC_00368 TaxID=2976000 RepID=UPI002E1E7D0B
MNDQPRAIRYIRTNVDGYARVSDIARQKEICNDVATSHGLTTIDTYEDICDPAMSSMDRLIADARPAMSTSWSALRWTASSATPTSRHTFSTERES